MVSYDISVHHHHASCSRVTGVRSQDHHHVVLIHPFRNLLPAPLKFVGSESDALENVAFTPEVLFEGSYYPICGLDFADDHEGADLVCRQLGFGPPKYKGRVTNTDFVYDTDAMPIGRCTADDVSVDDCSGGGNWFGKLSANAGACEAGNSVGVQVACEYQKVKPFFLNELSYIDFVLFVTNSATHWKDLATTYFKPATST